VTSDMQLVALLQFHGHECWYVFSSTSDRL